MQRPATYSLKPYRGELKNEDLLHLLRRCLFGVGKKDLAKFNALNIEQVMEILLKQSAEPKPPVQDDPDRDDPLVPKGKEWINAPYEDPFVDKSRSDALKGWIAGQILTRDFSLTEKMTLFWRNHFVTEMDVVLDARYSYTYSKMVRKYSLGNYKKLIVEGITNPAMLVYLNGNSNHKNAPNENFARELMELFTLGKGQGVDYSENDVRTAARVLTGWRDNKETIKSTFYPELHDTDDKQFSSFFDNHIIKGKTGIAGIGEVAELVDMLLKREEASLFFCRNLYRWFVYHEIDDKVEMEIIAPLSKQFFASNFEVAPVLKTLLSSEHFFDPAFRGCLVKSPVDFFSGAALQFDLSFPENKSDEFLNWIYFYFTMLGLLMGIGDPPSVAGWPAYYQEPKFGLWWINSHTLGQRKVITDGLSSTEGMICNGPILKFDFLKFVSHFETPELLDELIAQSLTFLCAVKVSENTYQILRALTLSGTIQNESQWKETWIGYQSTPSDTVAKDAIEKALSPFFKKIMLLPEFQMM
jgi:uncharacterized protein (DUF1800 family)